MKREPYAERNLLLYPGMNLSEREKQRMDSYEISINELTTDHIVYSMSRQIQNNFQAFYTIAEEIVGEEAALKIAHEIGRRYGGTGYANYLKARGMLGHGGPQMMAQYQDLVHSIRGPKHTAALYAQYDDEVCMIKRQACIYFAEDQPENGKYTGAFEAGCFEGYMAADSSLKRVESRHCRWKGDPYCEQYWIFKE